MDELFIRLCLDEDVDVLVTTKIQARGFSVTTARDEGKLGLSDAGQLANVIERRSAFVTHNRVDFEALAGEYVPAGTEPFGIIVAVRRPPRDIALWLLSIIDYVSADETRNQFRYI